MADKDLIDYVDMRIGVDNDGNTVIGPQRPNASINPSPDTQGGGHSGYFSNHPIRGFSQIHASGTGWGKYGQFLISPQIGLSTGFEEHDSIAEDEHATGCDYSVTLKRYHIRCRMIPSEHSAIYSFEYPASQESTILIDMAHSIPLLAGLVNTETKISASHISLSIDNTSEGLSVLSGSGIYEGGFGREHALYFYMVVKKSTEDFGCYDGSGIMYGQQFLEKEKLHSREESAGGFLRFTTKDREKIYLKISVSFTSVEKAKQWLEKEIPEWDENSVYAESKQIWNRELSKFCIGNDVSDEEKTKFYTAVYHCMCMPRDRTGDIPGYSEDTPMVDDHYAVWDTWRTLFPLYILIKPDFVAKTINSFIARYEKNGFVRDTFVGGVDMYPEQGGDDVDNVICDAYVKGLDDVDWKEAYQVVKNHADGYRLGWYSYSRPVADPTAPYYTLGFIPDDVPLPGTDFSQMACSFTLEHAYNDYCAATMARDLGTAEDYHLYLGRSHNWKNLWNPNAVCGQFQGFIGPRMQDGTWCSYNPADNCGSWVKNFYEGTGFNYSFFVPQDVPALIEKCGGEGAFVSRLLYGIESGLVDYSNEPAFLACFLFAYTRKPWLTSDCVEKLRNRFTLEGPPGNDDSGAMSSWYIFASLGFFPDAGQDLYFITSPAYEFASVSLGGGKSITITAKNYSKENRYIQSVRINGKPWHQTMFTHEMIRNGASIEYDMGNMPIDYTKN